MRRSAHRIGVQSSGDTARGWMHKPSRHRTLEARSVGSQGKPAWSRCGADIVTVGADCYRPANRQRSLSGAEITRQKLGGSSFRRKPRMSANQAVTFWCAICGVFITLGHHKKAACRSRWNLPLSTAYETRLYACFFLSVVVVHR